MLEISRTVNVVEILWTFITAGSVYLNQRAIRGWRGDIDELRKSGRNGVRRATALSNLRTEYFRLYRSCLGTVIGLIFMSIPNTTQGGWLSIIWALVFISLVGSDFLSQALENRAREHLIELEEARILKEMEQAKVITDLMQGQLTLAEGEQLLKESQAILLTEQGTLATDQNTLATDQGTLATEQTTLAEGQQALQRRIDTGG